MFFCCAVSAIFNDFIEENESLDDFGKWAFGEDYECLQQAELFYIWNKKHGDKYLLKSDSLVLKDAPIMIKLWRYELEKAK